MRPVVATVVLMACGDAGGGHVDADAHATEVAIVETTVAETTVAETEVSVATEVSEDIEVALPCDDEDDLDDDGLANCVDPDDDFDGADDDVDVCPKVSDPAQADADGDGLGDACDVPAVPSVVRTDPLSPSNDNHVHVFGTGEVGTRTWLFRDAACDIGAGNGLVDAAGAWEIQWHMQDDTRADFHAYAINAAGLRSACSATGIGYLEDSTAPAPPDVGFFGGVVNGTSEASANVTLYSDACLTSVATTQADGDGAWAIAQTFACEVVHATASDAAGNVSTCSAAFPCP